ncbi:MAG TPA: hypothetical protein VGV59_07815 [Pyrinomonadaceae bacterium]|nr:hypothetical protein [Pyrinomonadaceae bacterium]
MINSLNSINAIRHLPERARHVSILATLLLLVFVSAGAQAQTEKASEAKTQGETVSTSQTAGVEVGSEPLLREYKGVTLGISAADARAKLGKPAEKSDEMDFFVFSERERARVYYRDGKVHAIITTYIGKDSGAPLPTAVLGTNIEAKPDGSLYKMVTYPQAGYWVAYSHVPGDSPMVIVTMQKML